MRLFLTSCGLTNSTLTRSFCELLPKPIHQVKVAFIPTAANVYTNPTWLHNDITNLRKSGVGCIEMVDLASLSFHNILQKCLESDVIWINSGNAYYLLNWIRRSGLAVELPQLLKDRLYVGASAGSMIAGPSIETNTPIFPEDDDHKIEDLRGLNFVPFAVIPHMFSASFPHASPKHIKAFSTTVQYPIVALDDASAIEIQDGKSRLVSEGQTRTYNNSLNEIRIE